MQEVALTPYETARIKLDEIANQIAQGSLTQRQAEALMEEALGKAKLVNDKEIAEIQARAQAAASAASASATAYAADVAAKSAAEREATAREDIIQREIMPRSLRGVTELNLPLIGKLPLSPVDLKKIGKSAAGAGVPGGAGAPGGFTPRSGGRTPASARPPGATGGCPGTR